MSPQSEAREKRMLKLSNALIHRASTKLKDVEATMTCQHLDRYKIDDALLDFKRAKELIEACRLLITSEPSPE